MLLRHFTFKQLKASQLLNVLSQIFPHECIIFGMQLLHTASSDTVVNSCHQYTSTFNALKLLKIPQPTNQINQSGVEMGFQC
jgi:hypothetical protein